MNPITLSYVVATRNKLPYLKQTLAALISSVGEDEEIIVAEGAATDGTAEYLEGLATEGKIRVLHVENVGEAYAFNKAMEQARGTLIKLVTDDDTLHYPSIQRCKEFMLEHPDIDFLSTDGVKARDNKIYPFIPVSYQSRFEQWKKKGTPFAFCGLGIMIRKSSLPLLGYLHTGFVRVDAEYSLRVTASKAKLAWYTGEVYAHILNDNSNSVTKARTITEEMERLEAAYLGKPMHSVFETRARTIARTIKNWIQNKHKQTTNPMEPHVAFQQWSKMFTTSLTRLEQAQKHGSGEFLY